MQVHMSVRLNSDHHMLCVFVRRHSDNSGDSVASIAWYGMSAVVCDVVICGISKLICCCDGGFKRFG
jgi:hypothetical protein